LLNDWLAAGDAKRATRLRQTIVAHAETAVQLDPHDYDNLWSRASAYLYSGNVKGALADYKQALALAQKQNAPQVTVESLRVDQADALFFTGARKEIQQAIDDILLAMSRVGSDPKARFWNWSLGWAYYELAFYDKPGTLDNYARSLSALSLVPRPNAHVRKNIIANYVALERVDAAKRLASEFAGQYPGYTVGQEDKWPYASEDRRARFKDHLAKAGLPPTAVRRRTK
jgi:tetratricopeptide (TPR) repeat protein